LEYVFKHSLTKEAAYSTLLHERRKEIHRKVGEILESFYSDRTEEIFGLLAHHFEAAEDLEKALEYLIEAGDKTRLEDAQFEAADYYHRALNILNSQGDDSLTRATWLKLGLVYQTNFDFDAAHRAYEAAFALEERDTNVWEDLPENKEDQHKIRIPLLHLSTIDPGFLTISTEWLVVSQIFAGLVRFDNEMNVVPDVARSWEVLDDGLRYVFHLRDDVRWTDGKQVSAHDFVWGWTRSICSSPVAANFDVITGAQDYRDGKLDDLPGLHANNPLELEIRLQEPVATFLYTLAGPLGYPIPEAAVQAHGDEWWKPETIVSNGPFKVVDLDEEGLVLERNPTYFGEYTGNLDRVEFLFTRPPGKQESSSLIQPYLDGEIDILFNVQPEDVPTIVSNEELHFSEPVISTYYVGMDPSTAPLDNRLVREALAYAINREDLKNHKLTVEDRTAEGGIVPSGIPGHSPDLAIRHDPQLARQKLSEAGFPDGVGFPPLTLKYFFLIGAERAAEIARQWQGTLGIATSIREFSTITELDDMQLWLTGWIGENPDPHYFLGKSGIIKWWNTLGWIDPAYEALIAEASRASDRQRRMELYRRADRRLVVDEVITIPISYGGRTRFLVKPWVKQFQYTRLSNYQLKDVLIENKPGY
jgi:oligopeptide transport system substrate-binding protein